MAKPTNHLGTQETPVFELHNAEGRAIKIYVDGRVEGAPEDMKIMINRYPILLHSAIAAAKATRNG